MAYELRRILLPPIPDATVESNYIRIFPRIFRSPKKSKRQLKKHAKEKKSKERREWEKRNKKEN